MYLEIKSMRILTFLVYLSMKRSSHATFRHNAILVRIIGLQECGPINLLISEPL